MGITFGDKSVDGVPLRRATILSTGWNILSGWWSILSIRWSILSGRKNQDPERERKAEGDKPNSSENTRLKNLGSLNPV